MINKADLDRFVGRSMRFVERHGRTPHDVYEFGDVRARPDEGYEIFTDAGWIECTSPADPNMLNNTADELILTPNPDNTKMKEEFIAALQSL